MSVGASTPAERACAVPAAGPCTNRWP